MNIGYQFECELCGSPAVSLPDPLNASGSVHCAGCHAEIGSWLEYKSRIAGALRQFGTPVCADPIDLADSLEFVTGIANRPVTTPAWPSFLLAYSPIPAGHE
jgi:hypothetical protein